MRNERRRAYAAYKLRQVDAHASVNYFSRLRGSYFNVVSRKLISEYQGRSEGIHKSVVSRFCSSIDLDDVVLFVQTLGGHATLPSVAPKTSRRGTRVLGGRPR
jgi:hypothetical protein